MGVDRASYRYEPEPDRNAELRAEQVKLARQRPRYAYRRLHAVLERREVPVNVNRVYRLYAEEGLAVRRRKRKRLVRERTAEPRLVRANQEWAMDFIVDGLVNGRMVRILSVVDAFTCECLALDTSLGSGRVIRVLERLIEERGMPENVRSTTVRSLLRAACGGGLKNARSAWCTSSPAAPCRTATWSASTGYCATSASTQTGSAPSTMCATRSTAGARNTTASGLTRRSPTARRANLPRRLLAEMWKAKNASHIPTSTTATTAAR